MSLCVFGSIHRYIWDSYEAAGIKVHNDLYPTAVSESKDQLCASVHVILHIQVNPMIYSYNMNSGQVPGTIYLARDINQVAKTTGEEPSSEPSQMDLRTSEFLSFNGVWGASHGFLVGGWTNPLEKY